MITRDIQQTLMNLAKVYPVVTITGPRQAGKTTLAKISFPGFGYCNLEHPDTRLIAQQDPKSFFQQNPPPVIIDEIQRVPGLLSYIQVMADELGKNGMFILTGSMQLLLNESVSQSLAGRTALLTLLPFSLHELEVAEIGNLSRDAFMFKGFLPRIYDQLQEPVTAYRNYLQTYVERDVRQLINLKDLTLFEKFLRLLAGRVGQLINYTSLASDTGISVTTVSQWLSVLEASYIIFRLMPYYENYGKRVIKAPKIYFIEPGLAAYLLSIEDEKQIARDPLLGGLFENMVVIEALKARTNRGLDPNLYFFRDNHHNEIDLLYKKGSIIIPIEIKSSQTYNPDFTKNLKKFALKSLNNPDGFLIYGGEQNFTSDDKIQVISFKTVSTIFE